MSHCPGRFTRRAVLVLGVLALGAGSAVSGQTAAAAKGGVWIDPAWSTGGRPGPAGPAVATIWFEQQLVRGPQGYARQTELWKDSPRRALRRLVMDSLKAMNERSWRAAERRIRELEAQGVLVDCRRYWIINSVSCQLPGNDPARLTDIPGATHIFLAGRQAQAAAAVEPVADITEVRAAPSDYRPDASRAPWNARMLGVDRVWTELGFAGKGVLHVVHDFGWTLAAPAIRASLWRNLREVGGNGKDDDGNGYIDDVHGFDFNRRSGDVGLAAPSTLPGGATHGDLTAALMAGRELADTAVIIGISPASRWAAVVNGRLIEESVQWALETGADTYSMSFSIPNLAEYRAHWRKVMEHAALAGLFLVSGAGNFADSTSPNYARIPVQMRIPEDVPLAVFGVSGVGRDGKRPVFSSQGPVLWNVVEYNEGEVSKPDFATINTNLLGLNRAGGKFVPSERGWSGNSFAGPHTAGVIALMLEADPDLTPWRAREILIRTARDVEPAGVDTQTGAGLIDAFAAVQEVVRARSAR